ncbi:MAG: pseudouridine synthase [Pirellulaceae bacterium]|nr:pseudouridine synthase [Pirellulaceae bacterium]
MAKKQAKKTIRPTELISGAQRLNRVLASSGLGSRRDVEQLIVEGRVEVDGKTVTDLACKVDPKESTIQVDGVSLKKHRPVYFALNKPTGVLSTNYDPSGRTRVVDLVPSKDRIFPVGRLDRSSEGLMLLTNDGELAQRLAHPKYRIQKAYFVVVQGIITHEDLAKLRKGVYLADGVARIDGAKIRRQRKTCTEIEILLSEGKNREIRRILARVGHKVVVLRRLAIGPLRLAQLPVGQTRVLTNTEVEALYAATTDAAVAAKRQAERQEADANGTSARSAGKGRGQRSSTARGSGPRTGTGATRTGVTGRATTARGMAAASGRAPRVKPEGTGYKPAGFGGSQKTGSVLSYDEPIAKEPPIRPRLKRSERTAQAQANATSGNATAPEGRRPMRSGKPAGRPKPTAGGDRRRGKKPQGGSGGAR